MLCRVFQSAVMSTCFAKFHPNLVIGGTYCGQIVLWDNRSNKRTPIQRTPLSAAAHTVSTEYPTRWHYWCTEQFKHRYLVLRYREGYKCLVCYS